MNAPLRLPLPSWRVELVLVSLLGWAAFVAVPLLLGEIGLSWDALNHHFYLGWTAEAPRFGHDHLPAGFQTYQFPYLYWPAYRLASAGVSGAVAGALLASLQALAVPALWLVARVVVPEASWFGAALRLAGVVLGLQSIVVLSLLDTTANDVLAAVPLVWSVAFALLPMEPASARRLPPARAALLSGVLAGVAVACKLSNGPLAVLLPLLWLAIPQPPAARLRTAALGCVATLAGFALVYGYWGWQLWLQFGNPIYPFADGWFAPVRGWLGWRA